MKHAVTILDAIRDKHLFARWFKDEATWGAWQAFLAALFALPMTPKQLAVYQQCTGRTEPPAAPASEGWLVCGRRAGKSFMLALIAVYLACFRDWSPYLAPGERATIMVIATDRKQARVIFGYIAALVGEVPMLAHMIERQTAEQIDLSNGISIEVNAASFKSVRGYTIIAALLDELAFWPTEDAAEPDFAVLDAIRPAIATVRGALLLCASSPYARRGALWAAFRKSFGKDGQVLVWKADTRTMNPTLLESVVAEAYENDPASAAAEYGAEFRADREAFIPREVVEALVVLERYELPPVSGVQHSAFVDPSGGSADSMTLAIGHKQDNVTILDAVRERQPPFSPKEVVSEFAALLKSYGVSSITGDRYAGEWPRECFREHGINYVVAEKPKSEIYRDLLPVLNSGRVELIDHPRLGVQLCGLERRTARGGRDSIDHAPGAHDDLANALAGVVSLLVAGNSAEAWIRLFAPGSPRTQPPLVSNKNASPKHPLQPKSLCGNLFSDAYFSALANVQNRPMSAPKCITCGRETIGKRVTDGVQSWCDDNCRHKWTVDCAAQNRARRIAETGGLPLKSQPVKQTSENIQSGSQASKQIAVATYEYIESGDVPTRVSPGDGTTYRVTDRKFEGPAQFEAELARLGFKMHNDIRLKQPKATGQRARESAGPDADRRA